MAPSGCERLRSGRGETPAAMGGNARRCSRVGAECEAGAGPVRGQGASRRANHANAIRGPLIGAKLIPSVAGVRHATLRSGRSMAGNGLAAAARYCQARECKVTNSRADVKARRRLSCCCTILASRTVSLAGPPVKTACNVLSDFISLERGAIKTAPRLSARSALPLSAFRVSNSSHAPRAAPAGHDSVRTSRAHLKRDNPFVARAALALTTFKF